MHLAAITNPQAANSTPSSPQLQPASLAGPGASHADLRNYFPSVPAADRQRRQAEKQPSPANDSDSSSGMKVCLTHPSDEDGDELNLDDITDVAMRENTRLQKPKRLRTLTTAHQSAVLNALLAKTRFPSTETREEVGQQIGMSARKVQIWFQNRRQSQKRARARESEPGTSVDGSEYSSLGRSSSSYERRSFQPYPPRSPIPRPQPFPQPNTGAPDVREPPHRLPSLSRIIEPNHHELRPAASFLSVAQPRQVSGPLSTQSSQATIRISPQVALPSALVFGHRSQETDPRSRFDPDLARLRLASPSETSIRQPILPPTISTTGELNSRYEQDWEVRSWGSRSAAAESEFRSEARDSLGSRDSRSDSGDIEEYPPASFYSRAAFSTTAPWFVEQPALRESAFSMPPPRIGLSEADAALMAPIRATNTGPPAQLPSLVSLNIIPNEERMSSRIPSRYEHPAARDHPSHISRFSVASHQSGSTTTTHSSHSAQSLSAESPITKKSSISSFETYGSKLNSGSSRPTSIATSGTGDEDGFMGAKIIPGSPSSTRLPPGYPGGRI